jgi:hypothetical protein
MAEIDEDDDDPAAWALRRYREVYTEFEARHPAQLRANKFIDGLFQASRIRGSSDSAEISLLCSALTCATAISSF